VERDSGRRRAERPREGPLHEAGVADLARMEQALEASGAQIRTLEAQRAELQELLDAQLRQVWHLEDQLRAVHAEREELETARASLAASAASQAAQLEEL